MMVTLGVIAATRFVIARVRLNDGRKKRVCAARHFQIAVVCTPSSQQQQAVCV